MIGGVTTPIFIMEYIYLPYRKQAKKLIEEGDILLFRGQSFISRAIQKYSEGRYSHVALASWRDYPGNDLLECVEFKEWIGGRTSNLEQSIIDLDKGIDVYRVASPFTTIQPKIDYHNHQNEYCASFSIESEKIYYNGKKITDELRKMAGLPYGWKRIRDLMLRKIPFLRWKSFEGDYDDSIENVYPVCSTAVASCIRKHFTDITHHRSDARMTPSDIARSPLVCYMFTLEKDF